ncbi:transposase IS116/IS110/IS902 family protein [Chthoniobacter flavus]|uniref:IS110 family transposase n=1 Tax=Chthoniobacter flavus TaxID=191863 RepID=UPI001050A7E9|nr:IS110 family transposase [Chthoniobacter flavus]TCO93602.1 transposase IS116/IS110/IS902 family protein [Chthoniobacter flavus]
MIQRILAGYGAIDIGQEKIFIACSGEEAVRSFGTFSAELELAADHLVQRGIRRVAMEATGVYWIPLHDLLEKKGIEVTVFNGAHARNMPGRKSDVQDCQWHAMLHSHGLLVSCFIPSEEIRQLRCYYRLREDHLSIATEHIQHMQRALDLMNVRLHVVLSQLHGVSGLRVIKAILAGERDPVALSALCDCQILKRKRAEVIQSLQGHWQEHHLFALGQALESYEFCLRQMVACDRQIEALLQRITKDQPPQTPAPGQKVKVVRHNAPQIEGLHRFLITMTGGCDATQLPGISPLGFMKLIAEIGTDLRKWQTAKHFTSWLGLSPGSSQSGKRRKRLARKKTVAGQIFREAVLSLAKSKHLALGAAYRRIKARKGSPVAMVAIARKLAVLYYNLFTKGLNYVEEGVRRYEEKYRQQTLRYLEKTAKAFGFHLAPAPASL